MSSEPAPDRNVLIGTAGHVDHGKTRLVARLTGIDTDRLPEEKSRGISIDLGFAHWRSGGFRFGVVDVPGHERFVHNMVAGASGVDVALLVVAADDGVMPQTREHLDVMELLGVRAGVVAITKTDLVDDEMVELVREEVRDLVAGTFLEEAEIVPVCAATGEGTESLEAALVRAAASHERKRGDAWFRLPIDRVFTLDGRGTIVTGSSLHGHVRTGDTLQLLPAGRELRVRSVESHGETTELVGSSTRTALNIASVGRDDVERGMELVTPNTARPTRRIIVRLEILPSSPIAIRNRDEFRLHVGTTEVTARVVLVDSPLSPGAEGYAELRSRKAVVVEYGQRFILRRVSPAMTIAGGRVLEPHIEDRTRIRDLAARAAALDEPDERRRLSNVLAELAEVPEPGSEICWRTGLPIDRVTSGLRSLIESGEIVEIGPRQVHARRLTTIRETVLRLIRAEIESAPPRRSLPIETIRTLCGKLAHRDVVQHVLDVAVERSELVSSSGNLGPPEFAPNLSRRERAALEGAVATIELAGMTPPALRDLEAVTDVGERRLVELLRLAEEDRRLVGVGEQLWFTPAILDRYRQLCEDTMKEEGSATLSLLRQTWGVTRKWAVPVAEYLDATGVTVREGDVRRLRSGSDA